MGGPPKPEICPRCNRNPPDYLQGISERWLCEECFEDIYTLMRKEASSRQPTAEPHSSDPQSSRKP